VIRLADRAFLEHGRLEQPYNAGVDKPGLGCTVEDAIIGTIVREHRDGLDPPANLRRIVRALEIDERCLRKVANRLRHMRSAMLDDAVIQQR